MQQPTNTTPLSFQNRAANTANVTASHTQNREANAATEALAFQIRADIIANEGLRKLASQQRPVLAYQSQTFNPTLREQSFVQIIRDQITKFLENLSNAEKSGSLKLPLCRFLYGQIEIDKINLQLNLLNTKMRDNSYSVSADQQNLEQLQKNLSDVIQRTREEQKITTTIMNTPVELRNDKLKELMTTITIENLTKLKTPTNEEKFLLSRSYIYNKNNTYVNNVNVVKQIIEQSHLPVELRKYNYQDVIKRCINDRQTAIKQNEEIMDYNNKCLDIKNHKRFILTTSPILEFLAESSITSEQIFDVFSPFDSVKIVFNPLVDYDINIIKNNIIRLYPKITNVEISAESYLHVNIYVTSKCCDNANHKPIELLLASYIDISKSGTCLRSADKYDAYHVCALYNKYFTIDQHSKNQNLRLLSTYRNFKIYTSADLLMLEVLCDYDAYTLKKYKQFKEFKKEEEELVSIIAKRDKENEKLLQIITQKDKEIRSLKKNYDSDNTDEISEIIPKKKKRIIILDNE